MIGTILKQVDLFLQKSTNGWQTRFFLNWKEIKYVCAIWDQLHLEFDFEKLLPITRRKRALLNLNFLFATATST
jgi:hypothetical protein